MPISELGFLRRGFAVGLGVATTGLRTFDLTTDTAALAAVAFGALALGASNVIWTGLAGAFALGAAEATLPAFVGVWSQSCCRARVTRGIHETFPLIPART